MMIHRKSCRNSDKIAKNLMDFDGQTMWLCDILQHKFYNVPNMRRSTYRKLIVISALSMVCIAVFIILKVFDDNIVFFLSPSEVYAEKSGSDKGFRVGGLVKKDCVSYLNDGAIKFVLTDNLAEITVIYNGVVPSLFREGSGAVVFGNIDYSDNIFYATELLAKHDENYKPKYKKSE